MATRIITKDKKEIDLKTMKIALVGNPNCGKTTLFNQLTGSHQYVGNWPGVTVEKKQGTLMFKQFRIDVLDLPGIYSLSPYSAEEVITRMSLIEDEPDLIINIVDATNIERNLYLTTQLLEFNKPMIIAFNMTDIVEKKGDIIDYNVFRENFNVPVIPISANRRIGIEELLDLSVRYINSRADRVMVTKSIYDERVESVIYRIEKELKEVRIKGIKRGEINKRWAAIKLFEKDEILVRKISLDETQEANIEAIRNSMKLPDNMDAQMLIADQRYKYICRVCKEAVKHKYSSEFMTLTDKIDRVVTNKFLAVPIFIFVMLLIFYITFGPFGSFFRVQFEFFIKEIIGNMALKGLVAGGASTWVKSLVIGGIIEGVGSVISFLPQVMILFTLLSILEDSGYMARAAFITDKLLRKVGLSGRAFVPLLMGFGCTVPAVLGTRILEKERDKKLTILMVPFMSCSAKMPVYAMFVGAIFKEHQVLVISSIYLLGIVMAIVTGKIFNRPVLKGERSSFILELPEYRFPTIKNLSLHVWERVKDFIVKAGTVLVAATIIIWFLQSFNLRLQMVSDRSESILASIGMAITPIFSLNGFGNWRAVVSLLSGLIAKESIVSTMAVLYGTEGLPNVSQIISDQFTAVSAYAFMIFVLLYTPCIAALSAIYKELKSLKWTIIAVCYQMILAWGLSVLVYQIGTRVLNIV